MASEIIGPNIGFILNNKTPADVAKAMIESGRQKEPFYVFNMDEAYHRIQHFKKMMPRIQIFYAMKANDSDKMLKLAAELGLGFDCASPGEIYKILKLNISPLSIIFAVPAKTPDGMVFARESGIRHTTFDTINELKKIKQFWPDAKLLIRIKVDGESIYKLGEKFGCDFETEAVNLLEEAAALGLKVVGVAFHVGSACSSADSHVIGMRRARALFDHEARAGRSMNIIDIGGGFLSDRTDRIDQVSKLINSTLEELFPDPNIQVISEPGRYICDSSCNMYCSINNIRRVTKGGEIVNMIYLNDGVFGTLRFNEPWHTVKRFQISPEIKNDKLERTILWGPSCDSMDRVMQNVEILLPRCTSFDWLVFSTQGAYSFGFATFFSCLEKPLIRSVISQTLWDQIKNSIFFGSDIFKKDPDISSPLPSTVPPIVKTATIAGSNYTLKI
ncbi:ornithine decarboxylase 2-like isoform X1 [Nymphalis io]|uniref:ornithine decarboxylase 2-like isoform X1 n=1 Tax=Inachis io TaxID=171585 RepID=UPI002167676F|nr:ornithine decarboxylase 2-like isoform X1 [Nymphalis io]